MSDSTDATTCALGVNVDHVATLREARQTTEPDPVPAALAAERGGADQIVIHLREDRRHIQERDLQLLRRTVQTELNLELSTDREVLDIAMKQAPDRITLVPERREEVTTEGGLDVHGQASSLRSVTEQFQDEGIEVHMFIDPERKQIDACRDIGANGLELHTGPYADAETRNERSERLSTLATSSSAAADMNLYVAAGHGLDYQNVGPVAALPQVYELNIGHSIVSRSVFEGMQTAVRDMVDCIHRAS